MLTCKDLIYWTPEDYYEGELIRFPLIGYCNECVMWLHSGSQWSNFSTLWLDLWLSDLRGAQRGQTHLSQSVSLVALPSHRLCGGCASHLGFITGE